MANNKILNQRVEYKTHWDGDCVYAGIVIDPSTSKVYSKSKWVDDDEDELDITLFACPLYIELQQESEGISIHSVWKSELFDSVFEINGMLRKLSHILIEYGLVHCNYDNLSMLLSCIINCFVELGFSMPLHGLGANILRD